MLTLAWRNVWRNKRRSLITLASIACGLASIMFGQSLIRSIQIQLIEKATGIIIGHLRIMAPGNDDLKFPDKYISDPKPVLAALSNEPEVEQFEERILFTGLIASPVLSKGGLICAVDPDKDPKITTIAHYLQSGHWLEDGPKQIVLGDMMARQLDVRLGEKVVLMAQAADGSMGAEAFRLAGIFHTGSQSFDGQIAYIPVKAAQDMLAEGAKVNDFIVRLKHPERVQEVSDRLAAVLANDAGVRVYPWMAVDQEVVGIRDYQNALLLVVLAVVFAIVALGILNTILMSLYERVREFGVLMAIGAKPRTIMTLVVLESLILGGLGLVCGVALGSALIAHYGRAGLPLPIGEAVQYFMPFDTIIFLRFSWKSHLVAMLTVVATCVLAALPPALRAGRLKPAEALRHV